MGRGPCKKRVWNRTATSARIHKLAPAVCGLVGSKILLFDGQHKSAAQICAGAKGACTLTPTFDSPQRHQPHCSRQASARCPSSREHAIIIASAATYSSRSGKSTWGVLAPRTKATSSPFCRCAERQDGTALSHGQRRRRVEALGRLRRGASAPKPSSPRR